MTYGFIWFVMVIAAQIGAIARVLLNDYMNPSARVAWALLIISFPLVGVIVYFLLGEPWLARSLRRRASKISSRLEVNDDRDLGLSGNPFPDRFRPALATCERVGGCHAVPGNTARLAASSNAAIDDMVADFDGARQTIHVSFYIWLADNNGLKVVDAIKRACGRGVTCRVVVDAIGSRDLVRSAHWSDMEVAGAQLRVSLKPFLDFSLRSLNRPDLRNHRKIVVVDNEITFCGSQNCADPEFRIKPKYAPWVDIMVRFEGPIARQNQMIFTDDWTTEFGEDLSDLFREPLSPASAQGFAALAFGTGPMSPRGSMSDAFCALLHAAEREVVITTPYFVPDPQLLASIMSCARRGVQTTLVVPARNDSRIVGAISKAHYPELEAAGVDIFEFHGGLLHAKTLVVDRAVAIIGSSNMDIRSLYLNFENNIILYDVEFVAVLRERQDVFISSSTLVKREETLSRPKYRVIFDNILTIVGPLF